MPVGGVLMSRDRKAFRESTVKRQAAIARAEKEIERMEGQHDDDPDDRKRRTVCYCVPLPLNGCCFFSLRDCVLFSVTISVILNSLFLVMVVMHDGGWYGEGHSPFETDPLLEKTNFVRHTLAVDAILQILVGILLMTGIVKECSVLQLPYLVVIILCNVASLIVVLIDMGQTKPEAIAKRFILLLAHCYMWIHALSYYFLTKEHEERTGMLDR